MMTDQEILRAALNHVHSELLTALATAKALSLYTFDCDEPGRYEARLIGNQLKFTRIGNVPTPEIPNEHIPDLKSDRMPSREDKHFFEEPSRSTDVAAETSSS